MTKRVIALSVKRQLAKSRLMKKAKQFEDARKITWAFADRIRETRTPAGEKYVGWSYVAMDASDVMQRGDGNQNLKEEISDEVFGDEF